jgi:hypothetical protein
MDKRKNFRQVNMNSYAKRISILFFVCISLLLLSESTSASRAPLMLGIKTGYSMPADGDLEATMLTGVEAQFAVTDQRVFLIEMDYGSKAGISGSYTGNVSQSGNAISQFAVVSLMQFNGGTRKAGLYYGAGLAYTNYRISSIVTTASGAMFVVNAKPSRLGGLFTLGYGGRSGLYAEARYLFAGKKMWNPLINAKTDLGGFSLNAGYRLKLK